jgi:hypothetical protein
MTAIASGETAGVKWSVESYGQMAVRPLVGPTATALAKHNIPAAIAALQAAERAGTKREVVGYRVRLFSRHEPDVAPSYAGAAGMVVTRHHALTFASRTEAANAARGWCGTLRPVVVPVVRKVRP